MNIFLKACLAVLVFLPLRLRADEDPWQRAHWHEVDTLFANPGQGWMSQDRRPSGGTRFP